MFSPVGTDSRECRLSRTGPAPRRAFRADCWAACCRLPATRRPDTAAACWCGSCGQLRRAVFEREVGKAFALIAAALSHYAGLGRATNISAVWCQRRRPDPVRLARPAWGGCPPSGDRGVPPAHIPKSPLGSPSCAGANWDIALTLQRQQPVDPARESSAALERGWRRAGGSEAASAASASVAPRALGLGHAEQEATQLRAQLQVRPQATQRPLFALLKQILRASLIHQAPQRFPP